MDTVTVRGYDGDIALMGTDKDIIAIFHKGTKLNEVKSREHGTPFYDSLDFLKVIHPGEPLNVYDQPVRQQDKFRFRQQWERYQATGESGAASGTPLAVLFPYKPELVATLGGMHITTVEQLADLSDTAKQNIMFGLNLSEKAKQYLAVAGKGKEYHQLQAVLDSQKEQINQLVETINELRQNASKAPEPKTDELAELKAMVLQMQQDAQPKHRGWPKGKPRKPVQESDHGTL
jgi:hypothetical protein